MLLSDTCLSAHRFCKHTHVGIHPHRPSWHALHRVPPTRGRVAPPSNASSSSSFWSSSPSPPSPASERRNGSPPRSHPATLSPPAAVDAHDSTHQQQPHATPVPTEEPRWTYDSPEEDSPASPSGIGSEAGFSGASPAAYNKASYEVLRLDKHGRARHLCARRRDLLREHKLQPRDLRRIDPSVDVSKTPPSLTIKDNVVLMCLGGVRAIVTADKALLFEPHLPASRKFVEVVMQHLQGRQGGGAAGGAQGLSVGAAGQQSMSSSYLASASHAEYMNRYYQQKGDSQALTPPFELEVIESALMVATGRLDAEMSSVTQRVQQLLTKLPANINPVNLEELRRVKGALVELEQKADTLRHMLEELMDDEDELRELNLSSRPRREERRRQREREKLERELERARELKEEIEERLEDGDQAGGGGSGMPSGQLNGSPLIPGSSRSGSSSGDGAWSPPSSSNGSWHSDSSSTSSSKPVDGRGRTDGPGAPTGPATPAPGWVRFGSFQAGFVQLDPTTSRGLPPNHRPQHTQQHGGNGAASGGGGAMWPSVASPPPAGAPGISAGTAAPPGMLNQQSERTQRELRARFDRARLAELRAKFGWGEREREREREGGGERRRGSGSNGGGGGAAVDDGDDEREDELQRRLEGSEEDIQEAQEALEEMVEAEEEEREVEEVEDMIEYYLQKASATQDEAERVLAGARDLEESIGISLSARRYEVNRLELTLSIGSFAAAIGALVAGIFGMNMKSMLEMSVVGFWGVSFAIVVGCVAIFVAGMAYTRKKRIL